jgi:hypothetical protein
MFDAYDMTAFAAAIDTGMHPPELVQAYRKQAEVSMLRGITSDHNDNARRFVDELIGCLRALPDQLALQVYTTMVPIERLIREMPTYYALRSPSEVSSFRWTLDAKGDNGVTEAERFWRQLVCPHLQATFIDTPSMMVEGLDYSAYENSFRPARDEMPDYLRARLPADKVLLKGKATDLGKLMLASLTFARSADNAGLQAADIVASAVTRALNGSLAIDGWRDLGRLFIGRRSEAPFECIQLSIGDEQGPPVVKESALLVLRTLDQSVKSMHPPR